MIGLGNSVVKRKLGGGTPAAPVNISQPFLIGTGEVGTVVTCNKGVWTGVPTPTYNYDFKVGGVSVQTGTSNTYTVNVSDDGKVITCEVTATNSEGSASATTSNSITAGTAPVNTVAPTVSPSGTQSTGTVITANVGTWTGTPTITYEYRWTRNGSPITGAVNSTYTIQAADDGTTIRCEVRGTNAYGVSSFVASSNSVSAVNAIAPVNTVAPVISGSTTLGSTLTSTTGTWTGTPTPTYSYQWKRNGSNIGGATASTYVTTLADSSANITCDVTATNVAGSATAESNTITLPSYAPVNTVAPVVSGTAVVGQTLSTTNGTWTNSPSTFSYQWFRGATLISGATNSTYTLVQADAGNTSNIKCVVTASNGLSASADSNTVVQIFDATWWDFRQTLSITDTTINNAMNTYTITRKSISATASLGAYPMVGGTATTHSRNLYNPADSDAAKRITWAGTITHDANGVQGNGVNGTGNTFINTSTDYPTNDFTVIIYSRTNQVRNEIDLGNVNTVGDGYQVVIKYGDNNTYTSALSTQVSSGNVIQNTAGCFVLKRSGSTVTLTKDGVNIFTRTDNGSIKRNETTRILSRILNGALNLPSSKQYTHFEFLNFALNSTQETDIVNAVIKKENDLGRGVIIGNVGVLGDSTIASFLGQTAVSGLLLYSGTMSDIATPGDTINGQLSKWNALSSAVKSAMNYVFVQIGLNDLSPAESAATALGRYQSLINQINADTSAKIILGTMTPCKERLTDVYGPVNGLISYQKWLDMNEAIKGNGPNAIIGADSVATQHTDLLNDGNGNLAAIYEVSGTNDHIHENNAGRLIIANSWRSKV